MRPSIFPSDDSLPTWLHTTLLVLVVSPFSLMTLWWGVGVLVSGYLEPLAGPEFGQFFFGPVALHGAAARLAGFALLVLSGAFAAIAVRFSRFASDSGITRVAPWLLLALFVFFSFLVSTLA